MNKEIKNKKQNSKNLPCGNTNCMFADCVSIADGNDGVFCSVAPCEGQEGCPHRFGINN